MRKLTKRSAAVLAAAALTVGMAGAAWAAWSISGTGSASATAATAVPLTVTGTPVADALVPGSKSSVSFTVKNTNKFPVRVTSMTYTNFTAAPNAGCAGNIEQVPAAQLPGSLHLAVDEEKTYTYTDSLKLIDDPSNDCQGQAFGFSVVVGATSNVN